MVELIPFMLILTGWHPDHAGMLQTERFPALFETEAECRMHGENAVEGRQMYALEHQGWRYQYACMPVPAAEEYSRLFDDLDSRRQHDANGQGQ